MIKVADKYGKSQTVVNSRATDGYSVSTLAVKCPVCERDISPNTYSMQSHLRLGHKELTPEERRTMVDKVFPRLQRDINEHNSKEANK